jgi:predicted CXXCH cytochrome family protein
MRHPWPCLLLAASAAAGMVLACGCATQTKRQWLNFFFDGVPPERTSLVAGAASESANGQRTNGQPATVVARAESQVVFHPPYAEGKCVGCHESKFSTKVRSDLRAVCIACHKSFLAPAISWHAPAVSGECLICHDPHESPRKFLLTKAPAILCADCHDPGDMAAVSAHKEKGQADCSTCHNPHQSEERFLLKPKAPGTAGAAAQTFRQNAEPSLPPPPSSPTARANAAPMLLITNRAAIRNADASGQ